MSTYEHTPVHEYVNTYINTFIRVCIQMCIHICILYICTNMHLYTHTDKHNRNQRHKHTHKHKQNHKHTHTQHRYIYANYARDMVHASPPQGLLKIDVDRGTEESWIGTPDEYLGECIFAPKKNSSTFLSKIPLVCLFIDLLTNLSTDFLNYLLIYLSIY